MRGRFRTTRLIVYLAVAVLILGGAAAGAGTRALAAAAYLASAALVVGVQRMLARGGVSRYGLWTVAMALDCAAHALVVALLGGPGGPYLLLLALPILAWGVQRGVAGGVGSAAGASASYAVLLLLAVARPDGSAALPAQAAIPLLSFHSAAFLLLGASSGLLGRRFAQEEAVQTQMRRALEQAQLDAESIVEQLSRGIVCVDGAGRITRRNARAASLLAPFGGLEVGSGLEEIGARHPLGALARHLESQGGALEERTEQIEVRSVAGGGPAVPLEVTIAPILDRGGAPHGLVALVEDLTERRARESEERRRERLALVGQLSAGLAHEIRNSLKPITGSVELLRAESPAGGGASGALMEIILREAQSLESFLTEFLSFARDKILQNEPLSVESLIAEEMESLNALARGAVRAAGASPGPDLKVRGDRGAVAQVLRNLGVNALDAGGAVEVGWRREGADIALFVRDHGPGVPREIRERIWDPFFTTKPHGTGLGLAIAHDLADRMGGSLWLEPAEGGGTRACLRLPAADPVLEGAEQAGGRSAPARAA